MFFFSYTYLTMCYYTSYRSLGTIYIPSLTFQDTPLSDRLVRETLVTYIRLTGCPPSIPSTLPHSRHTL